MKSKSTFPRAIALVALTLLLSFLFWSPGHQSKRVSTPIAPVKATAVVMLASTNPPTGSPLVVHSGGGEKRNMISVGREWQIAMPELQSLTAGDEISVMLPDGPTLRATINISRLEEPDTWVVAAGFGGDSGGLTLRQNMSRTFIQGRIVRVAEMIAHTVDTDDSGSVVITERWREDVIPSCAQPKNPPPPGSFAVSAPGTEGAPPPLLNSKSDATAVLYIDFDGEAATAYPDWPIGNPGGVNFACVASDLTETQMTDAWRIIAEDYAPFNINVTTVVSRYNAPSAAGKRMRCIVTPTDSGDPGGAGRAYLRSFRLGTKRGTVTLATDVPCWVPTNGYTGTNRHRVIADAVAHEFGHTLGLSHDGPGSSGYYPGHGTEPNDWAPIMGNYRDDDESGINIVQWSKGEYATANNTEDDVAIISGTENGFGYRDDESTGIISAAPITLNGSQAGIISSSADYDYFYIDTQFSGPLNLTVTSSVASIAQARNLDVGLQLLDAVGNPIVTATPGDSMDATINTNVAPGRYYLQVFGTSYLTASTGYTNYGSLGAYSISGTLPPDTSDPVPVILSPAPGTLGVPTLQFNGTATDNDRVSGFAIFLRRNSDNAYWNGSFWQVGAISLARSFSGINWNCTAPLPQVGGSGVGSLNAGSYNFIAIAEDPAGHSKQVDVIVTVDGAGPTLTILSPTVTLGNTGYSFNGTSQDSNGVASVGCFIRRDSDGKYWDGSGWGVPPVSLSTNHVPNNTGGSHPWTCNSPNLPQPGGQLTQGTFTFIVRAADPLGNQSQMDSVVLIDDNSPPQVTVTTPPHNSYVSALTSISGTATDLSGIQAGSVTLTLYQDSTGYFWNGSDWVGTITTLHANLVGNNWSYNTPPSGSKLSAGQYFVSVHARDSGNMLSAAVTGINQTTFYVDLVPPTVSITTPLDGTTISSLSSVAGSANDSHGIAEVRLYLYRYEDGKFWDGSSWGGGGSAILPTSSGGGTWSSLAGVLPVPGPISSIHLTNGTYDIIAFAVDSAGNQTRADSVVTVDYHPVYTWTGSLNNDWDNEQNWLSTGIALVGQPDYDPVTGFIPSSNTATQRWQYGYTAPNGTGFANLSNPGFHTSGHADGGTVPVWNELSLGDMGIVYNSTDHVFHYNQGTYQPLDELGMFPNGDGRKSVVRWTAPTAGQYNFIGWFAGIESAGGGTTSDATIVLNASTNSPQPVLFHEGDASDVNYVNGYRAKKTFSFNLTLPAGATLDFRVGLGSNGNHSYDGTGLKLVIIPGNPIGDVGFARVPDGESVAIINGGSPTIPAGGLREVYKLEMNGGLFAQGELTVRKKFDWTAGQIWGKVNVLSTGELNISGSSPKYAIAYGLYAYGNVFQPGILNNAGTATWTGDGDVQMQWGAAFNNSGTFHIQTDADMTNYNGGAFVNTGSVDKAASSDATRLDVVVTNGGTMRADTGRLVFAGGGGVSTGEYHLTSVNCLEWAGGTHTLGTGAKFTGAGRALISGGTVQGAADTPAGPAVVDFAPDAELELATNGNLQRLLRFTGNGLWRWSGGIVWGTLELESDMQTLLSGADTKFIIAYNFYAYGQTDGRGIIVNQGTATWQGTGDLQVQWGAKFDNRGSLTMTSDADVTEYSGGSFVNQGLLRKNGSGGDSQVKGVVFSSPGGTLDVQTGTVSLMNSTAHTLGNGTQLTGPGRTRVVAATLTATGEIGGTGNFELAPSGVLAGTQEFVAATFQWTGGTIVGITSLDTTASMDISGDDTKYLQGYNLYAYGNTAAPGILVNHGNANWSGAGNVEIQWATTSGGLAGGTFLNAGNMSILTDADMTVYSGGNFINTGTLCKDQSTGVTKFDVSMFNDGTLYCQSGKVQVNGGGVSHGRFDMPAQNSLEFTAGANVLGHGASFTSSGRATITGGTVAFANTIPNNVTLGNGSGLELTTGGTLARDGTFIGSGTFAFTGGLITGTTNLNGATRMEISGPDPKYLSAYGAYAYGQNDGRGTLNLNSTAEWTGTGDLQLQWGSIVRNTGLLEIRSDAVMNEYAGGTFYNLGTLRKSASTGMSRISIVGLNNTGTVDVQTGVLSLVGNHALNPGSSLTGAGRLRTDGGTLTITGNVTGNGHFEHATGTLAGNHTFTTPTLHWTGGEIIGITTVGPAAALEISGSATKPISAYGLYAYGNTAAPGILNNQGSATWTGPGDIQTQWGAHFNNLGTFRVQTPALFSEYAGGSFVNSGQLVVGASPGIFNLNTRYEQTSTGVLNIELAGTNASTPDFDQMHCNGGCTLGGTLNVTLLNGFTPSVGNSFPIITYPSHSGEFAVFNSPGAYFTRNYNANALTLSVANAPSTLAEWKAAYFAPGSPESASDADPDGDGMTNFAEYAFNTSPLVAGSAPQQAGVETIDGQQWLTLGYRRWAVRQADGVVYTPQVGDLQDWGTAGLVDEVDPNAEIIPGSTACRCRVLIDSNREFLRVLASKP